MNHKAKMLWVEALSNGAYIQGHDSFRQKVEKSLVHCAVGVLIDIYCNLHKLPYKDVANDGYSWSPEFGEWSGLTRDYHSFIVIDDVMAWPWVHNDHFKVPFPVLAEAIKEQL